MSDRGARGQDPAAKREHHERSVCQARRSWVQKRGFGAAPLHRDPVRRGEIGTKLGTRFGEELERASAPAPPAPREQGGGSTVVQAR